MSAEGRENARLIEYAPHAVGDFVFHILPSLGAWVVVWIFLRKM
jgi:hypothetical protein